MCEGVKEGQALARSHMLVMGDLGSSRLWPMLHRLLMITCTGAVSALILGQQNKERLAYKHGVFGAPKKSVAPLMGALHMWVPTKPQQSAFNG